MANPTEQDIAHGSPARAWPLPTFVLVAGLLLSLLSAWQLDLLADRREGERFAGAAAEAHNAIEARLHAYAAVLRAGDGLFAAHNDRVGRAAFRAFVEELELGRVYPGIRGLGFSARLPAPDGPATEVRLAELGVPDLHIYPEGARPETHAIVHLEPMDRRNVVALGYDMFSDPTRREAMTRARDTGRSAMSGRVELVQEIDEEKQAGFLIYHPVYEGRGTPPTVAARREQLLGFVYAPFRAGDLLKGIFGTVEPPRVDFAVYDQSVAPENLLHKSFTGPPRAMTQQHRLSATRVLEVAGRRWVVAYYPTPTFERETNRGLALLFLCGGLLATLLVAAATWRVAQARLAAEAEIEARRTGEHQRRLLMGELNHRVKNTLATVQSIAAQTLREGKSFAEARETFESRLLALSHAHNLLTRESWRGVEMGELAALELAPYRGRVGARVSAEGERVFLPPGTALALGMALHELATNAAKYGALSNADGQVGLTWLVAPGTEGGRRLKIRWRENGGPPVTPPATRGFGARLIGTGLRRQLGGEVELVFDPAGVRCDIDVPLSPVDSTVETQPQP